MDVSPGKSARPWCDSLNKRCLVPAISDFWQFKSMLLHKSFYRRANLDAPARKDQHKPRQSPVSPNFHCWRLPRRWAVGAALIFHTVHRRRRMPDAADAADLMCPSCIRTCFNAVFSPVSSTHALPLCHAEHPLSFSRVDLHPAQFSICTSIPFVWAHLRQPPDKPCPFGGFQTMRRMKQVRPGSLPPTRFRWYPHRAGEQT